MATVRARLWIGSGLQLWLALELQSWIMVRVVEKDFKVACSQGNIGGIFSTAEFCVRRLVQHFQCKIIS